MILFVLFCFVLFCLFCFVLFVLFCLVLVLVFVLFLFWFRFVSFGLFVCLFVCSFVCFHVLAAGHQRHRPCSPHTFLMVFCVSASFASGPDNDFRS